MNDESKTAPPIHRSATQAVLAEQASALFARLPADLVLAALAAAGLVAVLWAHVSHERLIIWFGLQMLVVVGRALTWTQFAAAAGNDPKPWLRLYLLGMASSGALWGVGSIFIFPSEQAYQVILLMFAAGMAAASVTSSQPYPLAGTLFIALAAVPIAIQMVIVGGFANYVVAAMTLAFSGLVLRIAKTGAASIVGGFELKAQNEKIASDLTAQLEALKKTRASAGSIRREADLLHRLLDDAAIGFAIARCGSLELVDISSSGSALLGLAKHQDTKHIFDLGFEDLDCPERWTKLLEHADQVAHIAFRTARRERDGSASVFDLLISTAERRVLVLFRVSSAT
jgi:hypothetical protein